MEQEQNKKKQMQYQNTAMSTVCCPTCCWAPFPLQTVLSVTDAKHRNMHLQPASPHKYTVLKSLD